MGSTVKVMSRGRMIDRIVSPVQNGSETSLVSYRERLWPVLDGCIHIDREDAVDVRQRHEWEQLIARLLPPSLSDQTHSCSVLIESRFRGSLPQGVVQAICSLVSLRLERQARVLLVDFLSEKHDSARLLRLLQMQLLFMERTGRAQETAIRVEGSSGWVASDAPAEPDPGWEWAPADEPGRPRLDDDALRQAALQAQVTMGACRAVETGDAIPDFGDAADMSWVEERPRTPNVGASDDREARLVERTAGLGSMALDLLRYFADNPGDRAYHAEQVLGHPVSDINRLLAGSLGQYVKRCPSGGWVCHSWVTDVLDVLDGMSR